MNWGNTSTWIHYAPTILSALLAIVVLARALLVPLDVRREPCCGACQHPVPDLNNERCNECGGLLRKVGIVTPGLAVRFRAYLPLALLAWTAICGAITSFGIARAERYASMTPVPAPTTPVVTPFELDMELRPQTWVNGLGRVDGKKLNYRIEASVTASLKDGELETGTLMLTIRKNGTKSWSKIEIDLAKGSYRTTLQDGTLVGEGAEFAAEHAKAALDALKLDTTYKPVEATIADIATLCEAAKADPEGLTSSFDMTTSAGAGSLQMHSTSGGSRNYGGFMPGMIRMGPRSIWTMWQVKAGAAALGTIYLLGLGLIAWRYKRLVRI